MGWVLALVVNLVLASGMDGGCGDFKADIAKELNIWNSDPVSPVSGERTILPLATKIKYVLRPHSTIEFLVAPEKILNKEKSGFAGVFNFTPAVSGVYQLALGKRAWLDVVDAGTKKIIKAGQFEMQTKCDKLVKVMSYQLSGGKAYVVQINSSPTEQIEGTITEQVKK